MDEGGPFSFAEAVGGPLDPGIQPDAVTDHSPQHKGHERAHWPGDVAHHVHPDEQGEQPQRGKHRLAQSLGDPTPQQEAHRGAHGDGCGIEERTQHAPKLLLTLRHTAPG